jgi:raffinose/stachyose/melibiose transport system permease protein
VTRQRHQRREGVWLGTAGIVISSIIFLIPFAFIIVTSMKSQQDAALLQFSWPTHFQLLSNIKTVLTARDHMLITAFMNSTILTVSSVTLLVVFGSMAAYILQRRASRWNWVVSSAVLAGLIIPPAVVPTIWLLQSLHLFKTMAGLVAVEVAFGLSFTVLLVSAFVATIPREVDEAAVMDGAGPLRLFFGVIFPLLRSVLITIIVVQSVGIFNDFQNPLYFLPGDKNATVQLTLFNFQSQYNNQYNLLFSDILLVTIPPLIMFIFFNKRIVAGLTAGAVKG